MKNFHQSFFSFQLKSVFVLFIFIKLSFSAVPKPRGVSISRIPLYDINGNFTCFDGSKTIPYHQINDDYCDCEDSSDEPGTSACSNGKFYCTNIGYKPRVLTSDRVNDGICDCCDGSDEYSEQKSCENTCLELGLAAKEESARLAKVLKMGNQLRNELSQKGQQFKKEKHTKVQELRKNREEAEKLKIEKEELKKQAEGLENKALEYYRTLEAEHKKEQEQKEAEKSKEEALELFKKIDTNADGFIDIAEIKASPAINHDPNAEFPDERAKTMLGSQEPVDLTVFMEKSWPLIKQVIRVESSSFKPDENVAKKVEENVGETETKPAHGEDDEKEDEESEDDDVYDDGKDDEEVKETESQTSSIVYDEHTQNLVNLANEARSYFLDAEKVVQNLDEQIRSIERSLDRDFGPDEEFATLEDNCFEYTDYEYTYKLCPFDRTVQIPKSNSLETNLGRWHRWNGPANNPYEQMLYDNGQNCWNGPNRSTKVKVSCGLENKLTSVSEPNRCEYLFSFETPAACREPAPGELEKSHDEL